MAAPIMKDMIIKFHLEEQNLDQLLELADRFNLSLSKLFEMFIEDLIHDDHAGSLHIEDWLYARTGQRQKEEESFEDDLPVTFSKNQVEIMNLLDLILEN